MNNSKNDSVGDEDIWSELQQQKVFRLLLDAVSYPGDIVTISKVETLLILLSCLVDKHSSFADLSGSVTQPFVRLMGVEEVSVNQADFVAIDARMPPPKDFNPKLGTLVDPHFGATLLLVCDGVAEGDIQLELSGPGIEKSKCLALSGVHRDWFDSRAEWVKDFPMGVDCFILGDGKVVAVNRTTEITITS